MKGCVVESVLSSVGERVQIIKGKLWSVERELVRKDNRNYVVVQILQLVSVMVRVLKRGVKKI